MFEQLVYILASMEHTALQAYSQVADLVYYHPAWFILGVMFLYHSCRWMFWNGSKKRFTPEKCTNIMITGGAQGLGKLLVEQFLRRHQPGSINMIVVDIRGDLEPLLMKDIKSLMGDVHFKNAHFYKANLADVEGTKKTWAQITEDHGPVHVLVNNHAVCLGKTVEDLTIERFKLTMDINFHSYVQLCMLFL